MDINGPRRAGKIGGSNLLMSDDEHQGSLTRTTDELELMEVETNAGKGFAAIGTHPTAEA